MAGPLGMNEAMELGAGVMRGLRSITYINPAGTVEVPVVEASSKAFGIPPYGSSQEDRPTGLLLYRTDAFHVAVGGEGKTQFVDLAAADTQAGWIPGATLVQFPLHPAAQTVFVFATLNTSLLRASWLYGR